MSSNESFLSRWSRRKRGSRVAGDAAGAGSRDEAKGAVMPTATREAPRPAVGEAPWPAVGEAPRPATEEALRNVDEPAEPLPELPPIDSLTPASDFRPFMQKGVDAGTRSAALAKLFRDPHFSVTDGLDVYIDDYNETEPIPPALLASLKQLHTIGLSDDEIERMREGDKVAPAGLAGPQRAVSSQGSAADDGAATESPGGQAVQLERPASRLDAAAQPGAPAVQPDAGIAEPDAHAEQAHPRAEQSDPGIEQSDPGAEQSGPRDVQRVRKT